MGFEISVEEAQKFLEAFEELQDYWSALSQGNEEECIALVDMCEHTRLQWLESHNENQGLKGIIQNLERDQVLAREQMKELKVQLAEARAQIGSLQARCRDAESERDVMERQVDMVRELLKTETTGSIPVASMMQYDFLREKPPSSRSQIRDSYPSLLGENQIDYDHTEDSIDDEDNVSTLRSGQQWRRSTTVAHKSTSRGTKRRSRSVPKHQSNTDTIEEEVFSNQPRKRSRDDHDIRRESGPRKETLRLDKDRAGPSGDRRSLNRSFSQPHLPQATTPGGYTSPPAYHQMLSAKSTIDLRSPLAAQVAWTTPTNMASRQHIFMTKTTLIPEYCDACGKKMPFGKQCVKCQDCKFSCHPDCKSNARLPCVPLPTGTPSATKTNRLVELVPPTRPMVPHVIIHCVTELEQREALYEQGIYRTQGTQEEINQLFHKFMVMKGVPDLRHVSHDVLVGVIKKFLAGLKEPIITLNSRRDFRKPHGVLDSDYQTLVMRAVMELPAPNRDTLAFFVSHLQRVAQLSEKNKMPVSNLAKILAPTVIGVNTSSGNMYEETSQVTAIMMSLLELPSQFWMDCLTFDSQSLVSPRTPNPRPPVTTMLGPVTPFAPRTPGSAVKPKTATNKKFFQQPWK